ncbi:MAG: hypothetical protein SF052_20180 [Bacteroidia bacterium]|nr:hypothetical protein [Bacteroidia bacterium]
MIFRKTSLIAVVLLSMVVLFGCNKEKLKQLEEQNKLLLTQSQQQDSVLNDFLSTFNSFGENLDQIKERENLVSVESDDPELRKTGKDKILADIQMIDELMAQNRTMIAELEEKVKNSDEKLSQFRNMVARLNRQLTERDGEIAALKEELVQKNFTVEELNIRVSELHQVTENLTQQTQTQSARISQQDATIKTQSDEIDAKTTALNTAYFVKGSTKTLKEKNILEKDGGFLGIGGTKKLGDDISENDFTRIDITEVFSIPLESKKAKLVTNHPADSYVIASENNTGVLEITNPDKFWKNTKYLVVVTD